MTLSDEEIQEIINLRLQGKSIGYIVRKTGNVRNTVRKYLGKHGLLDLKYFSSLQPGSASLFQGCSFSADSQYQKMRQLNHELIVMKNENSSLKRERDELKHQNLKQEETIESQKQTIKTLEARFHDQKQLITDVTDRHQKEMAEKDMSVEKIKQEKRLLQTEYQKTLQRLKTGLDQVIDKNNDSETRNKMLLKENEVLKRKVQSLEEKLNGAPMKYGGLGVGIGGLIGGAVGVIGYHMINQRSLMPQGKGTTPTQRVNAVRNDNQCGIPMARITPGISFSGAYNSSGGFTGTPLSCSGVFPPTSQGNTGYDGSSLLAIIPLPNVHEATTGIYISGDQSRVSWSGFSETSGFTPQQAPSVSFPNQTPIHYYHYLHLPFPLPEDLSEVYPMKQIMALDGISFENFIEDLLIYRGCPTERTPKSGDKSADIITTLNGKRTIFECKQKSIVGIDTVQRVFAAKKHYNADQAIIVTTGTFTKDAIDEATRVLHIELWDGKRLLEELYKSQFFRLPK